MPETNFQPDQSGSPDEDRAAVQATASPAASDHLAHLPRMSATAGVATQEYVAINVAAVFALLLGFASLLAVIETPLVVICLAAIATALVSLRQIRRSNGTETGSGIATSGLFLAVAFGSFVGASSVLEYIGRSHDKQAIADVCTRFGDDLRDDQFDSAYDLFSNRFKSRVSRQTFVARMSGMQDQLRRIEQTDKTLGPVNGAHWNGLVQFYTEPESGTITAQTYIVMTFVNNTTPDYLESVFRKESLPSGSGDRSEIWTIDDVPNLFPSKPAPAS